MTTPATPSTSPRPGLQKLERGTLLFVGAMLYLTALSSTALSTAVAVVYDHQKAELAQCRAELRNASAATPARAIADGVLVVDWPPPLVFQTQDTGGLHVTR